LVGDEFGAVSGSRTCKLVVLYSHTGRREGILKKRHILFLLFLDEKTKKEKKQYLILFFSLMKRSKNHTRSVVYEKTVQNLLKISY